MAEFFIGLNCLFNIKTILVGSHLLYDQAWKFFTGLYISTRSSVCHASNILRHLCFHLEEKVKDSEVGHDVSLIIQWLVLKTLCSAYGLLNCLFL